MREKSLEERKEQEDKVNRKRNSRVEVTKNVDDETCEDGQDEGDNRLRRGDNRAVTELSFAHVTIKTLAYSGVFGFFRKKSSKKLLPPTQITF